MDELRSKRSKERILYHANKTIQVLRDAANLIEQAQGHEIAKQLRTEANELERASQNKKTTFDYGGGRGEWALFSQLIGEAA
jgi:hypothetical protein